jgi:two-component system nitrate/nitrite response regulator NarL
MQTQQAQAVSTRRTEIGSRKSVAAVEPQSPNLGAESIAVALVGGDMLFREGLKSLFGRSDLAVLGEFDRASDLESSSAAAYKPTIVMVVSPEFPAADPRSWRENYTRIWPDAKIVVLAFSNDETRLVDSLRMGADGCLFTDMSPSALVQALRLVAMGENVFPTRIGRSFSQVAGRGERPKLTPRERDILKGLLAGYSNKMIANELGTTDMTVKAQLRHLLRKLGVANRTQAALWAREQGVAAEIEG